MLGLGEMKGDSVRPAPMSRFSSRLVVLVQSGLVRSRLMFFVQSGSVRFGSVRLGSVRLGSVRFGGVNKMAVTGTELA